MADTFTYNTVTISNPLIESFRSEPLYAPDGQSTQWTVHTIRITGTVVPSTSLAANIDSIRRALMTPRKNLVFDIGGVEVFGADITAPDAHDGPKPLSCEFTDFVNAQFAFVRYEIEVATAECFSGANGQILSHTARIAHEYDERFMLTRTITGRIVVAENGLTPNPDALRGSIYPALMNRMKREKMRFLVSEDGQTLEYEFVDRQVYEVPPVPAISAQGQFVHKMTDGARWFTSVSIRLVGTAQASKAEVFNAARAVVQTRLDPKDTQLEVEIIESLYENEVSISIVAEVGFTGSDSANAVFPTESKMFLPLGSPDFVTELGPYGAALVRAAKIAFYDLCGNPTAVGLSSEPIAGNTNAEQSALITAAPTSAVQPVQPASTISSDHLQHPYTFWDESISYHQDNAVVLLPSSSPGFAAKAYQTHQPMILKVQEGRAVRSGMPVVPPAIASGPTTVVRRRDVTPHAPMLASDGRSFDYATSWRYEILEPLSASQLATVGQFSDLTPTFAFVAPKTGIESGLSDRTFTTPNQPIAEA